MVMMMVTAKVVDSNDGDSDYGDNVDDGDSNDDESQVNMIKCATKLAEGGKEGGGGGVSGVDQSSQDEDGSAGRKSEGRGNDGWQRS